MKRVRLSGKYRLITRSDFDGLVCGMLFQEAGYVDRVLFTHPKDMQDGTIEVGPQDIIAGLPFVPGCAICFDIINHDHVPQDMHEEGIFVCDDRVHSVARLVYTWFGGRLAFPRIDQAMLKAVDKSHSAQFTIDEILDPQGWVLLGYLMDARSGLGRFREFRLSNYQLMLELIPFCVRHRIDEILAYPDVAERVQVFREHQGKFREQILRCTQVHGDVAVLDLRHEDTIWPGNRFALYALFPQVLVSIHVLWGLRRQNTVFAVGRSIVNRSEYNKDISAIVEKFGGGGRPNAGSCQVAHEEAERVLGELVQELQQ